MILFLPNYFSRQSRICEAPRIHGFSLLAGVYPALKEECLPRKEAFVLNEPIRLFLLNCNHFTVLSNFPEFRISSSVCGGLPVLTFKSKVAAHQNSHALSWEHLC